MHIGWWALAKVAVVTITVSVALVTIMAVAANCLDAAEERELLGGSATKLRRISYVLFGVMGAAALCGIWLIVPWFK